MSNKTATIHLRIEPELKRDAETLLKAMGLSTTDAIKLFLTQVVMTGGIPFPIKVNYPNNETIKAIMEADIVSKSPGMSVDDFFKSLDNE
ncbi:MAG: type II toxin-antitoxin system RelB/DinJ family antitoxin [Clostridia bacterium]|nr:type II toxin-antitoxin system RelB/DinJ family antitoxin [Clostridia bacterium]